MAKITRVNGNVKAFASAQESGERTLFGTTTVSDDLTDQFNPAFLRGWGIVGVDDFPKLQDFNAATFTNGQLLAYLHQMGIPEYNAAQEFYLYSVTQFNGVLYMSIQTGNTGRQPNTNPAWWKPLIPVQATEAAAGIAPIATTPQALAGTDDLRIMTPLKVAQAIGSRLPAQATEATAGIAAIATQGEMAAQNNDTKIVTPQKLTSWFNTKVATYLAAGIAAFANASEVNAGTVENKMVNPATLRFGFQVLKAPTGYIKFPDWLGGLIVQWTKTPTLSTVAGAEYQWNYPIQFPNIVTGVNGMFVGLSQGTLETISNPTLTFAKFANGLSGSTNGPAFVFAWGF